VASVGTVLDAAALYLSASAVGQGERPGQAVMGPMLALAYGVPSLTRIGMSAGLPVAPSVPLLGLLARATEEPPPVTIGRAEYLAALDRLDSVLVIPGSGSEADREACWRRYAWVRSGYDQVLRGLAGLTVAPPAEWTTDRPARVGRPRLILARPIEVDWEPGPAT